MGELRGCLGWKLRCLDALHSREQGSAVDAGVLNVEGRPVVVKAHLVAQRLVDPGAARSEGGLAHAVGVRRVVVCQQLNRKKHVTQAVIHPMIEALLDDRDHQIFKHARAQKRWGIEIDRRGFGGRCLNRLERFAQRLSRDERAGAVCEGHSEQSAVDEYADLPVRFIEPALEDLVFVPEREACRDGVDEPLVQRDAVAAGVHILRNVSGRRLQVHRCRAPDELDGAIQSHGCVARRCLIEWQGELERHVGAEGQWFSDGEVAGIPFVVKPVGALSGAFFGAFPQSRIQLRSSTRAEFLNDLSRMFEFSSVKHSGECMLIRVESSVQRRNLERLQVPR